LASCEVASLEGEVELALLPPSSISSVRAVLLCQLVQDGNQEIIDRGYIYSDTENTSSGENRVSDLRRYGTIKHKLFNLKPSTTYKVRAYATTRKKEYLSNEVTFKTEEIPSQVFSLGDKGPGGGLVFLDWGDYSRGYRYMEARSLEASFYDNFVWSPLEFIVVGTSQNLGAGESNTDLYLQKILNTNPLNGFYSVSVFEKNGYQDWFIPSVEELKLVFRNLSRSQVLEEFKRINSDGYLSSTEVDKDRVYIVNADNQTESITFKGIGHNVLAVRVF
jgi:hypothetical protein